MTKSNFFSFFFVIKINALFFFLKEIILLYFIFYNPWTLIGNLKNKVNKIFVFFFFFNIHNFVLKKKKKDSLAFSNYAKTLLLCGADPNAKTINGDSMLMLACSIPNCPSQIVESLINFKADVNYSLKKKNAIQILIENTNLANNLQIQNQIEKLEYLLNSDETNYEFLDEKGRTYLLFAAMHGNIK